MHQYRPCSVSRDISLLSSQASIYYISNLLDRPARCGLQIYRSPIRLRGKDMTRHTWRTCFTSARWAVRGRRCTCSVVRAACTLSLTDSVVCDRRAYVTVRRERCGRVQLRLYGVARRIVSCVVCWTSRVWGGRVWGGRFNACSRRLVTHKLARVRVCAHMPTVCRSLVSGHDSRRMNAHEAQPRVVRSQCRVRARLHVQLARPPVLRPCNEIACAASECRPLERRCHCELATCMLFGPVVAGAATATASITRRESAAVRFARAASRGHPVD